MSVADRSIDPRIMESAKGEFLQKGFLDASLQVICKNAGVTTGALYKRFKGKEELFCALVESTVQDIEEVVRQKSALPMTQKGVGHGQGIYAVVVRLSLRPLR